MLAQIIQFPTTQQSWRRLAARLHNERVVVPSRRLLMSSAFAWNVAAGPHPQLIRAAALEWRADAGLTPGETGGGA